MPSEEQKSLVTLPQRIATALEGVDSTERAFVKIFLELEKEKCCKSMVVFLTGLCQEICEKHTDKQRSRCDFCFDRNDENAIQNYLKSGKALCDVRNLRRKLRTVLLGFEAKNSSIQRAKRNQN